MKRRILGSLLSVVAAIAIMACNLPSTRTAPGSSPQTPGAALVPAVKPTWPTKEEAKKINESVDEKAVAAMDAFVLLTIDDENRENQLQGFVLAIKMALHELYYDTDLSVKKHPSEDPGFYKTLVEFKDRIGSSQTGVFTAADMRSLFYYQELANYADHNVSPLGLFSVSQTGGYTRAQGTWVMQGEKLAKPINLAKIDCWRSDGACTVTDSELQPPSKDGGSAYITSDTSEWEIKSWSSTRVVAEKTTVCRRLVLTLDMAAKQVYHVATDLTPEGCESLGKLAAPRITTLVDSTKVERAHYEEIRAELSRVSKAPYRELKELLTPPTNEKATEKR